MTLKDLRIVFMGTPDFAVASLEALVKAKCNIVGVITAPDKPAGRGMKMTESAVKKFAVRKGLRVLQPEKLKNPEFLDELRALNADLQIVVAFRMLPESVWNMPPLGTINLHGSLLPQYRGAAPINWAVINGEKETGVTTFKLKHEIDTGNILRQERFPIGENDTAGEVHDKMKEIGARVLVETVKGIAEGTLEEVPQSAVGSQQPAVSSQQPAVSSQQSAAGSQQPAAGNEQIPTEVSKISETDSRLTTHVSQLLHHAPKITTDTCRIHWTKRIDEIHNLIRGLSPYPAAFTELGDKTIKIFRSEKESSFPSSKPGRWESDGKTYLKFAAKDGYIHLKDVQLEGKKRMSIEDFLRGYRFG
ncbi:MAG TPA: methionyl-tRNA formyltransferase [Chitinophagaceae bacterium]|nr:methionyl-tRNA formyltransferase [Chitinophagaceae bacterium]